MKKVSYYLGHAYTEREVEFLDQDLIDQNFECFPFPENRTVYKAFFSFTCEITVKIVPHEE